MKINDTNELGTVNRCWQHVDKREDYKLGNVIVAKPYSFNLGCSKKYLIVLKLIKKSPTLSMLNLISLDPIGNLRYCFERSQFKYGRFAYFFCQFLGFGRDLQSKELRVKR